MRDFVIGVELGAAATLLLWLAAKWIRWIQKPAAPQERPLRHCVSAPLTQGSLMEQEELERLTRQAGMQNFYLYDGSPQRDPREMARDALVQTRNCYERKAK